MIRPVKPRSSELKQSISLRQLCHDFFSLTQTFKKPPLQINKQNGENSNLKIAIVGRPFRVHRNKTVQSTNIGKQQIESSMESKSLSKMKTSARKRKKDLGLEKIFNFQKLLQLTGNPKFKQKSKQKKETKRMKEKQRRQAVRQSSTSERMENMNRFNVLTAKSKSINYRSINLNKTGYNSRQYHQKTMIYGKEMIKAKLTKSLCFGPILGKQDGISPWNEQQRDDQLDQKQFL